MAPRLWGCEIDDATQEFPLSVPEVVKARNDGVTRTNSQAIFQEMVKEHHHQPLLQTSMQQETLKDYVPACWVHGYCRKDSNRTKQHEALHRSLFSELRKQIKNRDCLCSGDVACAIRADTAAPICKIVLLCNMSLKPISGVFASMTLKVDSSGHESASLEMQDDAAGNQTFVFMHSYELVSQLLAWQRQGQDSDSDQEKEIAIYVTVLEHTPVSFGIDY